ncbi:MAG: hypothetical protein RIE58_02780 [Vicingaceae bacterium]
MKRYNSIIQIAIIGSAFLFINSNSSAQAIDWNIGQKIVASDRSSGDLFGWATAISGNTALVGAYAQDVDSAGSNSMSFAGLMYFFEYDSAFGWVETQRVNASDRDTNDWFGREMAIDGDYAIIGAPRDEHDASNSNPLADAGSAYIFERNSNEYWNEVKKLVPSDRHAGDQFGLKVDIHDDYAIIGADKNPTDTMNSNSQTWAGAAYIFKRNSSGNWLQVQKITASPRSSFKLFGSSVAIYDEWAVVGAIFDNYDVNESNFMFQSGSAYFYQRNASGKYIFKHKVTANVRDTSAQFGYSVSMFGDYTVIGADYEDFDSTGANYVMNAGAAYVFKKNASNNWIFQNKLSAKHRGQNLWFGEDVDVDDNLMVISNIGDIYDFNGTALTHDKGTGSVFEKNSAGKWVLRHKVFSRDGTGNTHFGRTVAVSGTNIIAGNQFQSYDQNGQNFISSAGAAYIFQPCSTVLSPIDTNYICQGDSLYYRFTYRSTAGLHLDTVESYYGCDSVIRMELIIKPRPTVDSVFSASRCGSGTLPLSAYVSLGSPRWYTVPTGGINFFTGTNYTTPTLSSTTTYYIGGFYNLCSSSSRLPITATINTVPSITGTSYGSTCDSGTVTLAATASSGSLNWFTASTGGSSVGSGSPFTTPVLYSTTGFYVEASDSNCNSSRTAVPAYVYPTPTVNTTMGSSVCDSGSMSLSATVSAGTLLWFPGPTGGPALSSNSPFITPVISSTTTYYAEAAANGCPSPRVGVDAVVLNSTYFTFSDSTCVEYTSPSGNFTYDSSGIYTDIIPNSAGCDSILTINLTVFNVDTSIVRNGTTLTSNDSAATYQWINCNNGDPIIGETGQQFTAIENGSYAVVVNLNGCSDTSGCVEVMHIGIELSTTDHGMILWPNPTSGKVFLETNQVYNSLKYSLMSTSGAIVEEGISTFPEKPEFQLSGALGVYLLNIQIDGNQPQIFRIVKE